LLIIYAIAKQHNYWYRHISDYHKLLRVMIDDPFHRQEAFMKFGSPVVCMVLLSVLVFSWRPAWSQETAHDATQMESQPAASEIKQPAVTSGRQPTPTDEAQTVTPDKSQTDVPRDSQPTVPVAAQPEIRIPEAVVCQDVMNRAPVGVGDVFAKDVSRVYCFTHIVGAASGTQLIHNWYYQGKLKASVNLTVGSSDFRTWSYKTMLPQWTGEWMVEVLLSNGTPLQNITFVIK
jgi:hypothetical protein